MIQVLVNGRLPFGRPEFHGMIMQSPDPVADFTLKTAGDQPVHFYDLRDKVILLYFGYTFCPDVCPATMSELATAVYAHAGFFLTNDQALKRFSELQVVLLDDLR